MEEEATRQANRWQQQAKPPEPVEPAALELLKPSEPPEYSEDEPDIPGAFSACMENMEDFIFTGAATSNSDEALPRTLKEAYSGTDVELWKSAIEEELQSLNSNHVYETILTSEGITPIISKPVFHIKWDQHGNVEQYKVQIVAWGFTQKEGVDYQEVFAPVANLDSVHTLIALAAKHDLKLD